MIIKEIEISDYRNLSHVILKPIPQINVIYGQNAQGKQIYWKQCGFSPEDIPLEEQKTVN